MNRSLKGKLALFATLYVSLGIPHGFFREAAPVIFREQGLSQEKIGLLALFAVPWMLKLIWAPFVDRFYHKGVGRRRSWILPMQVCSVVLVIALSWWNPDTPLIYLALATLLINLFASTQDAATDGYAIELLSPKERGWGNGIQTGGYWTGYILGGGAILVLQGILGWRTAFYIMAGIMLVAMVPVLVRPEPPVPSGSKREPLFLTLGHMFRDFWRFLCRRHTLRIIAIVILARMSMGFAQTMARVMLVDLGFTLQDIGWMVGLVGPIAGLVGALAGGWMANPLGRRRALMVAVACQLIPFAGYIVVAFSGTANQAVLTGLIALDHFVASLVMVPLFAFMMDWSAPEEGASEYTFMDCCSIFGMIATSILAGFITKYFGYTVNFAVGLTFVAVSWLLLQFLYRPTLNPQVAGANHHHQDDS